LNIVSQGPFKKKDIIILAPVYNDWDSFCLLAEQINNIAEKSDFIERLMIFGINDGSSIEPNYAKLKNKNTGIIHLTHNFGHQKAIALGLAYVAKEKKCDVVVIMDADGEDDPEDIEKLLRKSLAEPGKIIFAKRSKRHESFLFKFFYKIYRFVFRVLTGETISFGNFSSIPFNILNKLVTVSEIWNHYSGAVIKSKIPYAAVSVGRGKRFADNSRMNFNSLVLHGLSAISVRIDIVCVRILLAIIMLMALAAASIPIAIGIRIFSNLATPGWTTYVIIGLVVFLMQGFLIALILLLIVLIYRTKKPFIPAKEYQDFILKVEKIN